MRASGRAASGALVGAVLLLAGCSSDGDDQPVTLPSTTPSATSAEPTTPPPSAPASEPTPTTTLVLPEEHVASIDQALDQFFSALLAAQATRDFSSLDALYSQQCEGCVALRTEVEGWLAGERSVEGGQWVILQKASNQFPDGSQGSFTALLYRSDVTVKDKNGEVALTLPSTDVLLGRGSVSGGAAWTVDALAMAEPLQ